jgi:hypothetical protein
MAVHKIEPMASAARILTQIVASQQREMENLLLKRVDWTGGNYIGGVEKHHGN